MSSRAFGAALVALVIQSDAGPAPQVSFAPRESTVPRADFVVQPVALRAVWVDADACRSLDAEVVDDPCGRAARRIAF